MTDAAITSPGTGLRGHGRLALATLWCIMALSGFVMIEPAPFDLAISAALVLALLFGMAIPRALAPLVVLHVLFILFSMLSAAQAVEMSEAVFHLTVTAYLSGAGVFLGCMVYRYPHRALPVIMNGWTLAAAVAALAAIAGYFQLFAGADELFTVFGRAKGPFKDPNVLAPFLIPPTLYCFYRAVANPRRNAVVGLLLVMLFTAAIFLTFSRGGWGHLVASGGMAIVLYLAVGEGGGFKARLILFVIAALFALAVVLITLLNVPAVADLFAQRASLAQSYDVGGQGRFDGQRLAARLILDHPLGMGSVDFLNYWHENPHNIYLYVFMLGGWGGGVIYLAIVGATLVRSAQILLRPIPHKGIAVVLVASFVGVALEGVVVDTDHWRHFYFLIGLIWGLSALASTNWAATRAMRHGIPTPPRPMSPAA